MKMVKIIKNCVLKLFLHISPATDLIFAAFEYHLKHPGKIIFDKCPSEPFPLKKKLSPGTRSGLSAPSPQLREERKVPPPHSLTSPLPTFSSCPQ
jgi:hypothetical protein